MQWEYPVLWLKPKTCFFTVNIISSHVNNLVVRRWFLNSVLSRAFHNNARDKGGETSGSRDIMKWGAWVKIGLCLRACGRSCKINQWRMMFYSLFLSKKLGFGAMFCKRRERRSKGLGRKKWDEIRSVCKNEVVQYFQIQKYFIFICPGFSVSAIFSTCSGQAHIFNLVSLSDMLNGIFDRIS